MILSDNRQGWPSDEKRVYSPFYNLREDAWKGEKDSFAEGWCFMP